MELKDWLSLKVGSIIGNRNRKNPRKILEVGGRCHTVKIPSNRDRRNSGYTHYVRADRHNFTIIKI